MISVGATRESALYLGWPYIRSVGLISGMLDVVGLADIGSVARFEIICIAVTVK